MHWSSTKKSTNDAANFSKQTGIGMYAVFGVRYGDGVKDSTGNYYTANFPEQIVAGYSDAEKQALAAYRATTWKRNLKSRATGGF